MSKKRVTVHRGRVGKNGAYSVKHNDRKFDVDESEHIDGSQMAENRYKKFNSYMHTESFDEHELAFYSATFGHALEDYNNRQIKNRNYGRVKTMDEYRKSSRTCPEEIILQVGNRDDTIASAQLTKIVDDFTNWHMRTYPQFKLLDAAEHNDEPNAAPHCHLRGVWVAYDADGNAYVSQRDALSQMGVEPPCPGKKISRYNNAKVTYTKACRDKMIDIAKSYGVEVEDTPREPSQAGLELTAFKIRTMQADMEDIEKQKAEQEERQKKLNEREDLLFAPPPPDEKIPFGHAKDVIKQKNEQIATLQKMLDRKVMYDADIKAASEARKTAEHERDMAKLDREAAQKLKLDAETRIQAEATKKANVIISEHDKKAKEIMKSRIDKLKTYRDFVNSDKDLKLKYSNYLMTVEDDTIGVAFGAPEVCAQKE